MGNLNRQSFLNLVFLYSGVFLGFINTVLKVKVMTPEEIGVVAILSTLAIFFVFFISFGFLSGIRRYYSRFKEDLKCKTGFIIFNISLSLILLLFFGTGFYFLRDWFLAKYDNPLVNRYITAVYFFFIGNLLSSFFQYIFEAEYKSVIGNIYYDIVHRVLHLIFLIVMLNTSVGFYWYIVFLVSSLFLKVFTYLVFFKLWIKFSFPSFSFLTKDFLKEYFKYCGLTFSSGMTGLVTENIDKLMIGAFLTMEDVGIYSVVVQISMLIKIIKNGFIRIAYPVIAESWEKKNNEKIELVYKINSAVQMFLGSFIFIIIFSFPETILNALDPAYVRGTGVLVFIACGYLIDLSSGMSDGIISLSKYFHFDLYLRLFLVLVTIITNYLFIPMFGLTGAAFASALTLLIFNSSKIIVIWHKFRFFPFYSDTVKIVLLASFTGTAFKLIFTSGSDISIVKVIFVALIVFILYFCTAKFVLKLKILEKNPLKKDFFR